MLRVNLTRKIRQASHQWQYWTEQRASSSSCCVRFGVDSEGCLVFVRFGLYDEKNCSLQVFMLSRKVMLLCGAFYIGEDRYILPIRTGSARVAIYIVFHIR